MLLQRWNFIVGALASSERSSMALIGFGDKPQKGGSKKLNIHYPARERALLERP